MLLALLIARKIGITAAPNEMLMIFLTKAKYHLKTLLGISDEYYTSTEEHPVHGSGQGGKGLPGCRVIVSTLIISLMKNKTDGIQFTAPLTSKEINRIIDGFVDDTTLWQNTFKASMENLNHVEESPAIQIQQLQARAQWWEELLHATGGRLELDKCFYYILQWKFDKEGKALLATLPDLQQYNSIVFRQSETQNNETITHRDCHNSHKTLGVMENPSGNNGGERERLQTKASKMAQLMLQAVSLDRTPPYCIGQSI